MIEALKRLCQSLYIAAALAVIPAISQAACSAVTNNYLMDWNASYAAWTTGSFSKTITVPDSANTASTNVIVAFSGNTNRRLSSAYPQSSSFFFDATGSSQFSLVWAQDLSTNSEKVNITLTFEEPVEELSFKILDVDTVNASNNAGGFRDSIEITALNTGAGTAPSPTLTSPFHTNGGNTNSTVYLGAPLTLNQAAGFNGNAGNGNNQGNLLVNFDAPVTQVTIEYSNKLYSPSTTPAQQGIALGDLAFCTPETPQATIDATKTQKLFSETPVDCDIIPGTVNPDSAFAGPGACIEYVISITNSGDAAARDFSVVDVLNDNMVFQVAIFLGFQSDGLGYGLTTPVSGQDCISGACVISVDGARLDIGGSGQVVIRAIVK